MINLHNNLNASFTPEFSRLEKGGLADGIGLDELQQYLDSLGLVIYIDQTGLHPSEALNHR